MSDMLSNLGRNVRPIDAALGADGSGSDVAARPTRAEIDDLLSDPALTIEEKRDRLAVYTGQTTDRGDVDRGSEFEPLEMQLRDALAMLAEGGHSYGTVEPTEMDAETRSAERAADDAEGDDRF